MDQLYLFASDEKETSNINKTLTGGMFYDKKLS